MILGAGGGLARRKLIPALFRLELFKRLPGNMAILGCGRKPIHRQLALGGRTVLPAHRQAHGREQFGDLYPLQESATGFAQACPSR